MLKNGIVNWRCVALGLGLLFASQRVIKPHAPGHNGLNATFDTETKLTHSFGVKYNKLSGSTLKNAVHINGWLLSCHPMVSSHATLNTRVCCSHLPLCHSILALIDATMAHYQMHSKSNFILNALLFFFAAVVSCANLCPEKRIIMKPLWKGVLCEQKKTLNSQIK